jgi:hypothetical protein
MSRLMPMCAVAGVRPLAGAGALEAGVETMKCTSGNSFAARGTSSREAWRHEIVLLPSRVRLERGPHGVRFAAEEHDRLTSEQVRSLIERGRR